HAFAVNLIEDGYQVAAYDRDPERAVALRASGASAAAHLNELAGCDVVLTSLPDDNALPRSHSGRLGWWAFSLPGLPIFPRARSARRCPAALVRSMHAVTRTISPHRCSAIRTSRGHASSSYSPQARHRA